MMDLLMLLSWALYFAGVFLAGVAILGAFDYYTREDNRR